MEQLRSLLGALATGQAHYEQLFEGYAKDPAGVMSIMCDIARGAGPSPESSFVLVVMGRLVVSYPESVNSFDQQLKTKCFELMEAFKSSEEHLRHAVHFVFRVARVAGQAWADVLQSLTGFLQVEGQDPTIFAVILDEFNEALEANSLMESVGFMKDLLAQTAAHIPQLAPPASLAIMRMAYRIYLIEQAPELKREIAARFSEILKQLIVANAGNVAILTRLFKDVVQFLDKNLQFCESIAPELIQITMQTVVQDSPARNYGIQILTKLMTKFRMAILETTNEEGDVPILGQFLEVMTRVIATLPVQEVMTEEGSENLTLGILQDELPRLVDKYSDSSWHLSIPFMEMLDTMPKSSELEMKCAFSILLGWSVMGLVDYLCNDETLPQVLSFCISMIPETTGIPLLCGLFALWKSLTAIRVAGSADMPVQELVQILLKVPIGEDGGSLRMLLKCLTQICKCSEHHLGGIIGVLMAFCEHALKLPLSDDDKMAILTMFRICAQSPEPECAQYKQTILAFTVEGLKNPSDTLFYFKCLKTFVALAAFIPQDMFLNVLQSAFQTIMSMPLVDFGLRERNIISSVISTLIAYRHPIVTEHAPDLVQYFLAGCDRSRVSVDEISSDIFLASDYVSLEASAVTGVQKCMAKSDVDSALEVFIVIRNLLSTQAAVISPFVQQFITAAQQWSDIPLSESLAYQVIMVKGESALWLDLQQPEQQAILKEIMDGMIKSVPSLTYECDYQNDVLKCIGKNLHYVCSKLGPQPEITASISRLIFELNNYWSAKDERANSSGFDLGTLGIIAWKSQEACGELAIAMANYAPDAIAQLAQGLAASNRLDGHFGMFVMCAGVCASCLNSEFEQFFFGNLEKWLSDRSLCRNIFLAAHLMIVMLSAGKLPVPMIVTLKDILQEMMRVPKQASNARWWLLSLAITLIAHPVDGVDPNMAISIVTSIPFEKTPETLPECFMKDYVASLGILAQVQLSVEQGRNIVAIGYNLMKRSSVPEETLALVTAVRQFGAAKAGL